MAGSVSEDYGAGGRPSSLEEISSGQRCQPGDSLAEWRSCEQVENGTPSTSPPYWDTDDDDDTGPKPSELYGKFTWKIENFSQISKRELRSNAFEVGGYKWYILIYPQGCDVCNHLSLFLCVANHDKLLPGWSHFAQFTIAVVNKDPKKSKYSDTLHRFWKKEHDWGWKKFMELSKVLDGFIVADTLVIKAQVQVIREKTHRPFRCLDCQYRRELVRVYLSNVEQICRRFVEERRSKLSKLIEDRVRWSSFRAFWLGVDQNTRRRMSKDKTEAILKVVVKHFFIEKEVTSTLVMDSLYSGLKALECQSKNKKGKSDSVEMEEMPAPIICVEKDMFVLADDVLVLLERAAMEPMPPKDDKGPQSQSSNQNRTKDGNSGEEFKRDSIERDERRLTELGRRTVEIFVLAHIFSSRIEVAYQEAVALKRQEELIREEEAAGQAESELKAKRSAAEKEKRAKKKQAKQKRGGRKGKDRGREEKPDVMLQDKSQVASPSDDIQSEDFVEKPVEIVLEKVDITEGVSDVSDIGDDVSETLQPDLEDRYASPSNWDTDTSEMLPSMEASSNEIPNEQVDKKSHVVDDSSSTCSTDSVPSVGMNGSYRGNSLQNNKGPDSPSRGKNTRSKSTRDRTSHTNSDRESQPSDAATDSVFLRDANDSCRASAPESGGVLSLKDQIQLLEQHLVEKQEEVSSLQNKLTAKNQAEVDRPMITGEPPSAPASPIKVSSSQQLRQSSDANPSLRESISSKEPSANGPSQSEKTFLTVTKPLKGPSVSKLEAQKLATAAKVTPTHQTSSVSRPSSAPLIPGPRPTVSLVSTVQTIPILSRSVSAAGRLGPTDPLPSAHGYAPQCYRNAIMGKTSMGASSAGIVPRPPSAASTSQVCTYSQSCSAFLTSSMISPPSLTRTEEISVRPGFTFGSVNPEALTSGSQWTESSPNDASSSMLLASNLINETARLDIHDGARRHTYYPEIAPSASARQTQGTAPDEFPHLDIINYLFDEEQSTGKATSNGHNPHLMNRQYTFPGSLGTADTSFSNGSCHFEMPDQYYDDVMQRAYCSSNGPFDGRTDLGPQLDPSGYANGQLDGMILNRWQLGAADHPMLNMGPAESHGYPYQLPDYSNLAHGFNGYTMYRPANGR